MSSQRTMHRRRLLKGAGLVGAAGVVTAAGLTACTSKKSPATSAPTVDPTAVAATVTTPATGSIDVPAATEIVYELRNASTVTLSLIDDKGAVVPGELRSDGTSWVPTNTLAYGRKYTVTVTATGTDGKSATATSSFTTMAKPSKLVHVSTFTADNATVGVAMPLMITFSRSIPKARRADVQKRLFVAANPVQEGIWHWLDGRNVHYRTKDYWQPGSAVNARLAIGGLDLGDGSYGSSDVTIENVTIGPAVVMVADNATKKMTVTKNGKLLRTMPISLGKPTTPSSSGQTVIIEKFVRTIFDTFKEMGPKLGYRVPIDYAQRLTYGGEFIHSAPWSVDVQGFRNVSHGCINVSPANAKWLFDLTSVGDPVVTKGTERQLHDGNGWTDWNMSWEEYVLGSALPYVPSTSSPSPSPAASGSPSTSASPSTSP